MSIRYAQEAAERSTCPTRACGAVLDTTGGVYVTGYEGVPRGQLHCEIVGCRLGGQSCQRTVHAELNAIIEAARRGFSTVGATLYVSTPPHEDVIGAIINAGIVSVVYVGELASSLQDQLANAGIQHIRHI